MDRRPQPRTLVGLGPPEYRCRTINHYNRAMLVLTELSAKVKQSSNRAGRIYRANIGPCTCIRTLCHSPDTTSQLLYLRCWWCWAQRHSSTWQAAHTPAGPAGCFDKSYIEPIMQLFNSSICAVCNAACGSCSCSSYIGALCAALR